MSDITASTWSATDSSNTTAAPDGAPEGMAPAGLNDAIRAIMGGTKRWYEWSIPKTTAGTSTAYTLSYTVAPSALVDGMTHLVEFDQANGASATLNVNSLGAKPIHYYSAGAWRVVPASLFAANTIVHVCYNSSAGVYRIIGRPDRTGELTPFAGSTAPAGTLLCYGQAISRTTYAGLFALLSTTHGVGDGSTTFNLPDLRGRSVFGVDNMGGSTASRVTNANSGITGTTLGAVGGDERPASHTHPLATRSDIVSGGAGGVATVVYEGGTGPTQATGAQFSGASGNMPPAIMLNYLIRI